MVQILSWTLLPSWNYIFWQKKLINNFSFLFCFQNNYISILREFSFISNSWLLKHIAYFFPIEKDNIDNRMLLYALDISVVIAVVVVRKTIATSSYFNVGRSNENQASNIFLLLFNTLMIQAMVLNVGDPFISIIGPRPTWWETPLRDIYETS